MDTSGPFLSRRTVSSFHSPTGCEHFYSGSGIFLIRVAGPRIDRKSVCGPTNLGGMRVIARSKTLEEEGWDPMIMVGTGRLNMGVVFIEPEGNGPSHGFILPPAFRITLPELVRGRFEKDSVHRKTERQQIHACNLRGNLGPGTDGELERLRTNLIGIARIGKAPHEMVRNIV